MDDTTFTQHGCRVAAYLNDAFKPTAGEVFRFNQALLSGGVLTQR
jgi:hypothetical protein